MDIQTLTLFIDVAKLGSFAEAARYNEKDPSQVSRAIASLEQTLQIRLFKRSTRKLSLTESGERYLSRVKPLLEELNFAEDEARRLSEAPSGRLRVTASTAFGQICLLPKLSEFYQTYPDIEIDLQLSDDNIDLIEENIDLACRLSPSFQSDLIGSKLFETRYRVCASPLYLERNKPILEPQDLTQHKSVTYSIPQFRSRWLFRSEEETSEVKIRTHLTISNALALRESLLLGMGPGLVADWLVDEDIRAGRLIDIFPRHQVTATDFSTGAWLLYPSRKFVPHKTRIMIDFLRGSFTQNQAS